MRELLAVVAEPTTAGTAGGAFGSQLFHFGAQLVKPLFERVPLFGSGSAPLFGYVRLLFSGGAPLFEYVTLLSSSIDALDIGLPRIGGGLALPFGSDVAYDCHQSVYQGGAPAIQTVLPAVVPERTTAMVHHHVVDQSAGSARVGSPSAPCL